MQSLDAVDEDMAEVMCAGVYAEDEVEDYFSDETSEEDDLGMEMLDFDAVEAEFEASLANAPLLTLGGQQPPQHQQTEEEHLPQ